MREMNMKIKTATSYYARMLGLLGTTIDELDYDALHISPCRSVHTYGMRYPLDLAYIGGDGIVIGLRRCVEPNQICASPSGTRSVLERPSSHLPWFDLGDHFSSLVKS